MPTWTSITSSAGRDGTALAGAVAAAFHKRPGTRVVVLFPDGRVSPRQQHQLTCWGENIISLSVRGEFDDCQRLAKELFAESEAVHGCRLVERNRPARPSLASQALDHVAAQRSASGGQIEQNGRVDLDACGFNDIELGRGQEGDDG